MVRYLDRANVKIVKRPLPKSFFDVTLFRINLIKFFTQKNFFNLIVMNTLYRGALLGLYLEIIRFIQILVQFF